MKVLFIYTLNNTRYSKPLWSLEQINFGISYISSFLKKHGHVTRLAVISSKYEKKAKKVVSNVISEFKPDLIGFHVIYTEYNFVEKVCRYIKILYPSIYIIAGGPHVSLNPQHVITGPFDSICIGEGEYPMLELLEKMGRGLPLSGVKNLWFKHDTEIEKNPTRDFIADLDKFPFPDRDIWLEWIEEDSDARLSINLGRGCPFKCTYCCNHALSKISNGIYVRLRSPKNILAEIKYLHKKFPSKKEYFLEVETFNINKLWLYELCKLLEEYNDSISFPLAYGTNLRIIPNSDFENLFSRCSKANIRKFTIGLESGSQRIRKEIMNREYSNEDVIRITNQIRKYGLLFSFQNMIGLPTETERDFMQTVKLNRTCQPDWYYLNIFYPYPGTELAQLCKETGLLRDKINFNYERRKPLLDLPSFSKRTIQKRYYLFEYDVYRKKKNFYKIAFAIILRVTYSYNVTSKILGYLRENKFMQKVKLIYKT